MSDYASALERTSPQIQPRVEGIEVPEQVKDPFLGTTQMQFVSMIQKNQDMKMRALIAADTTSDPEEGFARWEMAQAYSKLYNVSPVDIFSNLEQYNADFFGKKTPDFKTAPRAILDAGVAQAKVMDMGRLYTRIMLLDGADQWTGGAFTALGFQPPSEAEREAATAKIAAIKAEVQNLQLDVIPRPWYTKFAKTIAGAVPYTADVALKGAAAGLAVGAAASSFGTASPAAVAALKSMATTLVGYTAGVKIMVGMEYADMIDRGIEPKAAAKWATLSGLIQPAIEQFVGMEGAIAGAWSKGAIGRVTEKATEKLLVSGVLTSAAQIYGARVGLSALGEMAEEGSQSIISGVATYLAQSMMEDEEFANMVNPITIQQIAQNTAESMITAAIVAPALGLPFDIALTIRDTGRLSELAAQAPTMDKSSFKRAVIDSGVLPEGMAPETVDRVASSMYETQTTRYLSATTEAYTEAKKAAGAGQYATEAQAAPERMAGGVLRVSTSVVSDEAGGRLEDYTVASTRPSESGKADQYANISILVSPTEARIMDSEFTPGYESLAPEIIQDIAARYQGKNITVAPGIDATIAGAYEAAIAESPLGEAFGPGWNDQNEAAADVRAKNRIRFELSDQERITPAQREGYIGLLQQFSNAAGVSFSSFTEGLSIRRDQSGALRRAGMAGAVAFEQQGKIVMAEEALKTAKTIIYMAENASMPTLMHETMHGFRVSMQGSESLRAVEEAYGVQDGKWTRELDERLANEFMAWSRDEAPSSPALVPLFKKIASWLKNLWNGPLQKLDLDERVRKAFESWVSSERVTAAEVDQAIEAKAPAPVKRDITSGRSETEAAAIQSYSEKVIARRRGSSESEARAARIEAGEVDAQLVAEAKMEAGIELTEEEKDIIAVAKSMASDPNDPETWPLLFMSQAELKATQGVVDEAIDADAREYDTWEAWAEALGSMETMTDKDKAWLKNRWEVLHDLDASKTLYKDGAFAKMMAQGSAAQDFVELLSSIIYDNAMGDEAQANIASKIAMTPELNDAVNAYYATGNPMTDRVRSRLLAYIRQNEIISKYLYAEAHGDQALAHEALTQTRLMPEIVKREFFGKPGRTLAEQAIILSAIKDRTLAGKIEDRTATYEEVEAYIASLEKGYEIERAEVAKSATEQAQALSRTIKERAKELAAIRKVRALMKRYEKFIFKAPKANVDALYRRAVVLLQEALKAGPGTDITKLPSYSAAIFRSEELATPTIGGEMLGMVESLVDSINGRPMAAWSLADMALVADTVDALEKIGRARMAAIIVSERNQVSRIRRHLEEFLASSKAMPKVQPLPESEGWKKRMDELKGKTKLLPFMRHDVFFRRMFGKEGEALFVKQTNAMYNNKYQNYARRTDIVKRFIDEKNIAKTVHRQIVIPGVMADGSNHVVTAAQLMGISAYVGRRDAAPGEYNEKQRDAVLFGNFFNFDEKKPRAGEVEGEAGTDQEMLDQVNARLRAEGQKRLAAIFDAIDQNLTDDEKTLVDMMMVVLDNEADKIRFSDAVYKVLRTETKFEKFFFPLVRTGDFTSDEGDAIMASFKNAGFGDKMVDVGMSIDRQTIQPRNQRPVETDIMRVFFDSVLRQEHLINYGPEVKQLRSIVQSPQHSVGLQNKVALIGGRAAQDYLGDYLDALAAPTSNKRHTQGSELLGMLRGFQVVGNLAFRMTGPLMQALTSPLPFIQEAPMELLEVLGEYIASGHPVKFYKDIEAKSSTLEFRQVDLIEARVKEITENNAGARALKFVAEKGMAPYTFVDRVSVAIGWEAVRRKKTAELTKQAVTDAHGFELSEAQQENIDKSARLYADMVVNRTQPTSEAQYRAPAYRTMDSFAQIMLQFTQPLNVIWNQIAYDIPDAIRANHLDKALAIALSYALSGLAVGLVQALRGRGPEDDEKWAAYWLHASTSQFSDSIPFAGEFLTGLTRSIIVGDRMFISDNNLPAISALTDAADQVWRASTGGDDALWGRAAINAGAGLALMAGLPVGAAKEGVRFYKAIAGEE